KRSDLSEDTSSNKQARTFSLTYSVGGPEDIRHRKRRLFGQSDDAIDRKKNRIFFSTTNDGNDGSDDNKTNSLPAFEDETSERWKMGGSGSGEMITYHDVDMTPHNESLDTEEIKAEVVRHDENFTKSFHGKGHHHRVNKFHHKDLRKGKPRMSCCKCLMSTHLSHDVVSIEINFPRATKVGIMCSTVRWDTNYDSGRILFSLITWKTSVKH
ncbi:unnamed protein product, partial [Nesidiocoris tenuis]